MSVRVFEGDTLTIAMNFSGSAKRQQEVNDSLAAAFPHLRFNLIDVYTMSPTVLWVEGEPWEKALTEQAAADD